MSGATFVPRPNYGSKKPIDPAQEEAHRAWSAVEQKACSRCRSGNHGACLKGKKLQVPARNFSRDAEPQYRTGTCSCADQGHTLYVGACTASDQYGNPCHRAAKATIPATQWGERVGGSVAFEREACGIHVGAHTRQERNREESRLRAEARRERDEELDRRKRAAEEWAKRLLDEFGVECHARNGNVVVSAEKLFGQIAEAVSILLDVVGEEHPFRPT